MTPSRGARRETSAGGVVVRCTARGPVILLIHDAHRNWGFPKGHLQEDEGPEAAARREIAEETGLDELRVHAPLGTIDWRFRTRAGLIHKFCHYYLCSTAQTETRPERGEGIRSCRWLSPADALERLTHANARRVLEKAIPFIERLCASGAPPG